MGHSKRAIAKITGASRNTISKYIDCPDKIPVAKKPGKASPLTPYTQEIKKAFLKCGGNCETLRKTLLETLGLEVKGRNLRRFCQPWRTEAKKARERQFKRLREKYQIRKADNNNAAKENLPVVAETGLEPKSHTQLLTSEQPKA